MARRRTATRPDHPRALVTGGSGGIGQAIARQLAEEGCQVVIHASGNLARARALAEDLNASGLAAEAVGFDLTDAAECRDAMGHMLDAGPIQILVHNAGIHADGPMAGMDSSDWERVIEVNLHGFYRVVQPAVLPMCRARWGRIIAISSVAGRLGNRGQSNYSASKAGLHGAVFSLARELAGRGICSNVIAPGIIQTAMSDDQFEAQAVASLVPAGRTGRPEEVAALAGFLCRSEAGYINGQIIGVDGGMACG